MIQTLEKLTLQKNGVVKLLGYTDELDPDVGSGFVVDSHTIATAAHCVMAREPADPFLNCEPQITTVFVFNGNSDVEITINNIKEIHIPRSYAVDGNSSYDYALITVEEDLTDYEMFNLGFPLDSITESSATVYVTGFPEKYNDIYEVNTDTKHTMYTGSGAILNITKTSVIHAADSTGGNSGGPIYLSTTFQNKTYYSVIAILTGGGGKQNSGTRITTNLLHFYKNNPNIP